VDLDRGAVALPLHLDDHAGRDDRRARGVAFRVDVLPDFPPRPNAFLQIVTNLLVLAFALVFVWWGIEFRALRLGPTSELAELPMAYIFIAWPVAGVTWVIFLGEAFVRELPRACGEIRPMMSAALAPGAAAIVLFGTFLVLFVLRVPVAFAFGLACLPSLVIRVAPVADDAVQRDLQGVQLVHPARGSVLLADREPHERGRVTDRLVRLFALDGGPFPGALAQINVLLSVFFAGIFGLVYGGRGEPEQDLHRRAGQEGYGLSFSIAITRSRRCLRDHPALDPDDRVGRDSAKMIDRRSMRSRAPA